MATDESEVPETSVKTIAFNALRLFMLLFIYHFE